MRIYNTQLTKHMSLKKNVAGNFSTIHLHVDTELYQKRENNKPITPATQKTNGVDTCNTTTCFPYNTQLTKHMSLKKNVAGNFSTIHLHVDTELYQKRENNKPITPATQKTNGVDTCNTTTCFPKRF